MGNYDVALPLLTDALAGRWRILGDEDPIDNIANLNSNMGNHDLVLPLHEKALDVRRRVLGNAHPHTLYCINNLAILRDHINHRERKPTFSPYFQKFMFIGSSEPPFQSGFKVVWASGSPPINKGRYLAVVIESTSTSSTKFSRNLWLSPDLEFSKIRVKSQFSFPTIGMGEHAAAAMLMREALAGRRRVLGEDHPHTQSARVFMERLEEKLPKEAVDGEEEQDRALDILKSLRIWDRNRKINRFINQGKLG
jgi:hypothetical protein